MKKLNKDISLMENLDLFLLVSFFIWLFSYRLVVVPIGDYYLKKTGTRTRGVIISSQSLLTGRYSTPCNIYVFDHNGKQYKGNSQIPFTYDVVGDSIDIAFFDFWPDFNKPLSYFKK